MRRHVERSALRSGGTREGIGSGHSGSGSVLRAPAGVLDLTTGKLRWAMPLKAVTASLNGTALDNPTVGHKTSFYDVRVVTLMNGLGVVNSTVYAAFQGLNKKLAR